MSKNENEEVSVNWKTWSGWRTVEMLDESDGIIGGSGQWEVYVIEITKILQLLAMLSLGYDHWRAGLLKDRKKS